MTELDPQTNGCLSTPTDREYEQMLHDAIDVLTEAARLGCRPTGDPCRGRGQIDWAEFVTLALAGAAANIGGVESVLAGRPSSWEAEGPAPAAH